jgi:flagellar motility protein MotE (MotC chaperone)
MEKMIHVQELLHGVQRSLRRMPGICANEARQMVSDLQEVGQLVSTESGHMIDCIVNQTLDAESSGNDFARMSVDHAIHRSAHENALQRIKDLEQELEDSEEKAKNEREKLEREKEELQNDFRMMSAEFAQFRDKVQQNSGSPNSRDELVKVSCFGPLSCVSILTYMDRTSKT